VDHLDVEGAGREALAAGGIGVCEIPL